MRDLSRLATPPFSQRRSAYAIAVVFALGGCASLPDAKGPESAAAQAAATAAAQASATPAPTAAAPGAAAPPNAPAVAAAAAAATAAAAAAQSSKPFAEVIKDAKEHPGMFPLW